MAVQCGTTILIPKEVNAPVAMFLVDVADNEESETFV